MDAVCFINQPVCNSFFEFQPCPGEFCCAVAKVVVMFGKYGRHVNKFHEGVMVFPGLAVIIYGGSLDVSEILAQMFVVVFFPAASEILFCHDARVTPTAYVDYGNHAPTNNCQYRCYPR